MSKPINIYYSPVYSGNDDWTFLFPKPKTLFNNLRENKSDEASNGFMLSCPAISDKTRKILVFNSPMSFKIEYGWNSINDNYIRGIGDVLINAEYVREPSFNFGPCISFAMSNIFFADEPVDAYFTPPMFHKPGYTNYGSVIPGEFNVGKWFRPYNFETQMWSNSGVIEVQEGEPLFYVEFKTDRPINLHRFNLSTKTNQYLLANVGSTRIFGRGQTLLSRYKRFEDVGFREKILTEIKNNLIDEEPLKF